MDKTLRLINLMLIFIPVVLLAFLAGSMGFIFLKMRRWNKLIF